MSFVDSRCHIFTSTAADEAAAAAASPPADGAPPRTPPDALSPSAYDYAADADSPHAWAEAHAEFQGVVESLVTDFLADLGVSPAAFVATLGSRESELNATVAASLLAVDDFPQFRRLMAQRNGYLQRQVLRRLEARAGGEGAGGGEGARESEQTAALRLLQLWVSHRVGQHRLAREVGRLCAALGAAGPHEDQVVHSRRVHAGPRECLRRCGRVKRCAASLSELETSREMSALPGGSREGREARAQLEVLAGQVGAWEARFRGTAAAQRRQFDACSGLLGEASAAAKALAPGGWGGALQGAAGEAQLGAWAAALGPEALVGECAALEVALQARRLADVRVDSKAKNAARRKSRKRARAELQRQGPASVGGSGYATAEETDEDEAGSGEDERGPRRPGVGFTGLAQSVRAFGSSLWGARSKK